MIENLKLAKLPQNYSKQDILNEIERLEYVKMDAKNDDSAQKILINSIYGVIGFDKFICYNRDVARSVTKDSEFLIKYTIECYNYYFKNVWHTLTDIHEKLGVKNAKPTVNDVVNYADTDSVFFILKEVLANCEFSGNASDLIVPLYRIHLEDWLNTKFEEFINKKNGILRKPNGDKALVMELEQVCHSVIWVAKKKYIKNIQWEGVSYKDLEKIQAKGLEMNQSSTPKYVREKLNEVVYYILENKAKIKLHQLIDILAKIKSEFSTIELEHICRVERVGDYKKFIVSHQDKVEVGPNCKPHVKGAAYYNYLVLKNKLGDKYELINGGDKVAYYYTKKNDPIADVFSFPAGQPFDPTITPSIDRNVQYEKVFLGPLNNILTAIKMQKIQSDLIAYPSLNW